MKPAPVPLFNYRKRQRQAIVTDPQQQLTSELPPPCSSTPQSHKETPAPLGRQYGNSIVQKQTPGTVNTNSPSNSSKQNAVNKFTANSMKQGTRPGLKKGQNTFSSGEVSFCSGGGQGTDNTKSFATSGNTFKFQGSDGNKAWMNNNQGGCGSGRGGIRGTQTVRGRQFGNMQRTSTLSSSLPSPTSSLSNNYQLNKTNNTFNGQGINNSSNRSSAYPSNGYANSRGGSWRGSKISSNDRGRGSFQQSRSDVSKSRPDMQTTQRRGCGTANFSRCSTMESMQQIVFENDDFDDESSISDGLGDQSGASAPQRSQSKQRNHRTPPTSAQSLDKSQRIFTCPIASLKSWAASNLSPGMVMFEVYGVIDSATVKDSTGTGREFILRDDTSFIKCVFYEIDRDLPRLTRGQVYRVVGSADIRRERLRVVSVRPAEQEERHICQMACQLSQKKMEQIAKCVNEQ